MTGEKKVGAAAPKGHRHERGDEGVVYIQPGYSGPETQIDLLSQGRLGVGLRGMYEDLLKQPVPDHLADLIRRLS